MEQSRLAGKPSEANEVANMLRRIAPAQVVVRCGFCATTIGPQSAGGRNDFASSRGMGSGVAGKVSLILSLSHVRSTHLELTIRSASRARCAPLVASNYQRAVSA